MAKNKVQKHLFISDFQIPDHDTKAIQAVYKFIADFKPDVVHNVGDFLNCTKVSAYAQDARYHVNLIDEIELGREILRELVKVVKTANSKAEIIWYEGNHEERITRYLAKADQLADLKGDDGEFIISLPHLMNLKQMGVKWVGTTERYTGPGGFEIEHGDRVASKSGATAHKMMEARGTSGLSGHTHRLAFVMRSWLDFQSWWIETGSMCKREMDSPYMKRPGDWQQGFAVGVYSEETKTMYPTIVPIFNGSFVFGDKVYKA